MTNNDTEPKPRTLTLIKDPNGVIEGHGLDVEGGEDGFLVS